VGGEDEDKNAEEDGDNTLDDEYPLPSSLSPSAADCGKLAWI
jgi:hypothetical protein